ncbi:MAG: hypothetical protein MHM6MM_007065 [Cercozoa sp. M6MM]
MEIFEIVRTKSRVSSRFEAALARVCQALRHMDFPDSDGDSDNDHDSNNDGDSDSDDINATISADNSNDRTVGADSMTDSADGEVDVQDDGRDYIGRDLYFLGVSDDDDRDDDYEQYDSDSDEEALVYDTRTLLLDTAAWPEIDRDSFWQALEDPESDWTDLAQCEGLRIVCLLLFVRWQRLQRSQPRSRQEQTELRADAVQMLAHHFAVLLRRRTGTDLSKCSPKLLRELLEEAMRVTYRCVQGKSLLVRRQLLLRNLRDSLLNNLSIGTMMRISLFYQKDRIVAAQRKHMRRIAAINRRVEDRLEQDASVESDADQPETVVPRPRSRTSRTRG